MLNKSEFFSKIIFLAVTHIFYNGFGFCTSKIGLKNFLIKMSTLLKKFKIFPIEYNAKIVELFLITSRFLPKKFFLIYFRYAESESVIKNGCPRQKFGENCTVI